MVQVVLAKTILKIILENSENTKNFELVAINEINPYIDNIIYSINHDSTYGNLKNKFKVIDDNYIKSSDAKIKILNHKNLKEIDLSNIDIIIDASGVKTDINILQNLSVKAIFLTHPNSQADINVILGANEEKN